MSLIGIRSSNDVYVAVHADPMRERTRARMLARPSDGSGRQFETNDPISPLCTHAGQSRQPTKSASGRSGQQTNEKVIHRNTIIIIIDARGRLASELLSASTAANDRENNRDRALAEKSYGIVSRRYTYRMARRLEFFRR